MKKFFAMLLSLVLILSLSVPAFAADISSTEDGSNTASQNVTASYTPSSTEDTAPAVITGLYITVDGVTYSSTNTSAETPATIYSDSTVTVTLVGENFENVLPYEESQIAFTYFGENYALLYIDGSAWTIDAVNNTATRTASIEVLAKATSASELKYTNDGWSTDDGSGVYVIYNEGTKPGTEDTTAAEITGVSITVDGTTYTTSTADNPVVITPTSAVTITVTGTNFANATAANYVFFAWGTTKALTSSDVTVDTVATPNTASFTPSGTEFSSLTEAFGIQYTNDAATNLIPSGIYVIYDSGLSEDELPTVTGVELTGGYASYDETSKTYTITPTSGDVTIKITGTNFANLSGANSLYIPGLGWTIFNELWTIDTANNIATITLLNSDFSPLTTAQQFQFDAGEEDVSMGVYLIYQSEIVSVDISWGTMSFTYSDEQENGADKGWSCDDGANKIIVSNSGTVKVNAAVAYKQIDGYSAINGSFQSVDETVVTNANIDANGGSYDFYLILSGKPEAALDGDTIGSVTVTITKASE